MKKYINKNNILEIIISIVVIIGIILICIEYESPVYSTINKTKELKRKDFTMYKGVNGSHYELSNEEEFPIGYTLDTDKTYCKDINENKIKNIVSIVNNKIQVISDKTVYCYLYLYATEVEWVFDYTGSEQEFTAPYTGTYKLETWGAQGGYAYSNSYFGGYGAYSVGNIKIGRKNKIYINVGGAGINGTNKNKGLVNGGYNGGGNAYIYGNKYNGSGGGATHIAENSGELRNLENFKGVIDISNNYYISNIIMIVASGGGASSWETAIFYAYGGHGGGIKGNDSSDTYYDQNRGIGLGGSQTTANSNDINNYYNPGAFGLGGGGTTDGMGAGSGFFGGSIGNGATGGGGGSSYIANPNLTNKHMTCYNCQTSDNEHTKTISNTCVNANPVADCSKQGNGYAKITFIG